MEPGRRLTRSPPVAASSFPPPSPRFSVLDTGGLSVPGDGPAVRLSICCVAPCRESRRRRVAAVLCVTPRAHGSPPEPGGRVRLRLFTERSPGAPRCATTQGAHTAAPPSHHVSLLSPRYNSDRRLSELSDYRRLADSPLAYRRSPTKSPMDYRRLPEAHADYARYSGAYGDYLPAARVHSGYQRRL